jgi:hypothetical protein
MENLPTPIAALQAPSPTQLQTLPLEIRHRIYESLIDLPCTIIVSIDHSVADESTLVKDESRGNLGALSESCKRLREEIHSWASALENRGIVITKAFGVIDLKLSAFRFDWTKSRVREPVDNDEYPAPQTLAHVINILALWKAAMRTPGGGCLKLRE